MTPLHSAHSNTDNYLSGGLLISLSASPLSTERFLIKGFERNDYYHEFDSLTSKTHIRSEYSVIHCPLVSRLHCRLSFVRLLVWLLLEHNSSEFRRTDEFELNRLAVRIAVVGTDDSQYEMSSSMGSIMDETFSVAAIQMVENERTHKAVSLFLSSFFLLECVNVFITM